MELIKVCKKRKYKSYADAYAFASASDIKSIDIYECDICKSYHLTSKTKKKDSNKMWKIYY